MFPSRTIVIPTNPSVKHLSPDKLLDSTKGLPALYVWLKDMTTVFIPYGTAKTEFFDQQYAVHEPPKADDVFVSRPRTTFPPDRSAISFGAPPMSPTNLDTDFAAETGQLDPSRSSGQPLSGPPSFYKYDQDSAGTLSAEGIRDFRKAFVAWENLCQHHENLRQAAIACVITHMTEATIQALSLTPNYQRALKANDLIFLRLAIEEVFQGSSVIVSFASLTNLMTLRQEASALSAYQATVNGQADLFKAAFGTKENPEYVKVDTLIAAFTILGVKPSLSDALLDQIAVDTTVTSIHDLTTAKVNALLTTISNTVATRAENAKLINPTTNTTMSLQQAQKLVKEHNKTKQQQQSNTGNALINTSPTTTTNNNNTNKKSITNTTNNDPKRCQWSKEHPHTWVTRPSPGPGDINLPHCHHCAKINLILNNHGHGTLKPCSDIRTASDEQQALLSNFVALMNGTASQHQRDSLNVFMDSGIFDASALASMNSGLGAPVPDADADEEARRACGGGPAPKN